MSTRRPVAVVVGATSKWQADGRNTKLAHGKTLDDRDVPVGIRWGVGGAVAQKFAQEGFHVVLTTRSAPNAKALDEAIRGQGGASSIVELDLVSEASITKAFASIRARRTIAPNFAANRIWKASWENGLQRRACGMPGMCADSPNEFRKRGTLLIIRTLRSRNFIAMARVRNRSPKRQV